MKTKKCIRIIYLSLLMMIAIGLFSNSYAVSFNTDSRSFDAGNASARSGLHYSSKDGTRYAIRINGQDIAGEAPAHCYWVYYRGSHYWVGEGVDHEAQLFTADNAPFRSNLSIDWKPSSGSANTSNFGLSSENVKCLVNAIKAEAQTIGDSAALAKIGQIERGEVTYEIRADIIMLMTYYNKHSSAIEGIIDEPETYLKFNFIQGGGDSNNAVKAGSYYMTYREANKLCDWLNANDRSNYAGEDHGTFKKVAQELFVLKSSGKTNWAGVNYYDEYIGAARSPKVEDERINDGFDYIPFTSPYVPAVAQTIIRYKDIDSKLEIVANDTCVPGATVAKKDFASWVYVGVGVTLPEDRGMIPDSAIDLSAGNADATEVTFWYRRPRITVEYVVQKGLGYGEGDWFGPYRGTEILGPNDIIIPYNDNTNYFINGFTLDGVNIEYTDVTKYALNDSRDHLYRFWYKPYTVIRYLKEDGTELLSNEKIYNFSTANANKEINGYLLTQLRRYAGGDLTGPNIVGASDSNNIGSGKYIGNLSSIRPIDDFEDGFVHTYTFWYQNSVVILRYKDIDTKQEIHGPGRSIKGGKPGYIPIDNYTYLGLQITEPYKDPAEPYLKEDSIDLKDKLNVTEVTFWYESSNQPKLTVKYVLLKNKNDQLVNGTLIGEMNPNPEVHNFKKTDEEIIVSDRQLNSIKTINGIDRWKYNFAKSSLDGNEGGEEKFLVKNNGKDREVIFGVYLPPQDSVNVKVIGACESNLASRVFEPSKDFKLPYKHTYDGSDYKDKWEGYELITEGKNACVVHNAHMWRGEKPDKEGGKIDINQTEVPPNEILVIFYFKKKADVTELDILYKDIATEDDILGPERDIKPAVGEHKAPSEINNWKYTKKYSFIIDNEVVEDKKEGDSVNIPDNKKHNTIIFWYSSNDNNEARAKWVLLKNSKLTNENFTSSENIELISKGPDSMPISYNKEQINELPISNSINYIGAKMDKEKPNDQITKADFSNDGNNHSVIFGYTMGDIPVKVVKAIKSGSSYRWEKVEGYPEDLSLPISKTYSRPAWGTLEPADGDNIGIFYNTLTFIGQNPTGRGDSIPLSVKVDEYQSVSKGILLVFYYKANIINVKHINITKNEQIGNTIQESLIPGENKTIRSVSDETNLNYKVKLDGQELNVDGLETYSPEKYVVTIMPDGKDHELVFEYVTQYINVRHEFDDGGLIQKPETKEIPKETTPVKKLDEYTYVGYKLNDGPLVEGGGKINIKPNPEIKGNQKIVFIYKKPGVYIDPKTNKTAAKLGCGIKLNTMNNQVIKKNDKDYWVLDETGIVTIKFYNDDRTGIRVGGTEFKISFPFDIIYGNELIKAGSEHIYTLSESSQQVEVKDEETWYNVFTAQLQVKIPVWAVEGLYENQINVQVGQNFNVREYDENDNTVKTSQESSVDKTSASVNIVGAVYDFSVTNIDGSTTTGDTMWKASLFTNPILKAIASMTNKEYETSVLPIGQASQQNAKYLYGMKLGTRFYFSVNTKGTKNTAIEITPKFYYFDKTGKGGTQVTVRSGNTDITSLTRTTTLTDANRTTSEYQKELAQGRTTYGANAYSNAKPTIFANKLITIGTGLRTPFVNYGNDPTSSKYHESKPTSGNAAKVYSSANHWYADYVIPNNATFFDSNNKPLTDGFVVVTFSIKTKAGNDEYLAYNLNSPFNQKEKQSEWKYEGAGNVTLPKTATLVNGASIGNMIKDANGAVAYASAAIYQISPSTRTSQNVDSAGTH